MKTYSIGRDLNCDIIINDNTDVISRRHALLNVSPSGKMTIIDQSSNGTYVNGIRISPNVPVPVTRKDTVSLAHVARLDWNRVPRPNAWVKWVVIALVVAGAIIAGIVIYNNTSTGHGGDATQTEEADSIKAKAKADSIKDKQKKDTADKARKAVKGKSKKENKKENGKATSGKKDDNGSAKGKNSDKQTKPATDKGDKDAKKGRHTMG